MTPQSPSRTTLAVLAVAACFGLPSAAHAAQTCETLNKLDLPATSITRAESVPAGSFTPPAGKALSNLPAFCRVAGVIKPSSDSDIQFEVWMPASNWNGKFQGVGNGGFAGSIGYDQLGNAVAHNYATAATDTGHHAGGTDAAWALDHPEKIADFGHRAIHETAVKAKAILHAFYGEDAKRSYFSSCSNGGRPARGQLFPGYAPGGEAEPGCWTVWITGPSPEHSLMYAFSTQFFKNMVFDNAAWDYHTFNTDRDTKAADDKQTRNLNATDPDLGAFRKRGGKLILYHGWSDAAIAAQNTIDYYGNVAAKMGAQQTATFVRLFMVPGMQHCGGGSGPNTFGQFSVASGDADHDIDAALERWVEKGVAPERLVAAKRKSDFDPASAIVRTRPLCAYRSEERRV